MISVLLTRNKIILTSTHPVADFYFSEWFNNMKEIGLYIKEDGADLVVAHRNSFSARSPYRTAIDDVIVQELEMSSEHDVLLTMEEEDLNNSNNLIDFECRDDAMILSAKNYTGLYNIFITYFKQFTRPKTSINFLTSVDDGSFLGIIVIAAEKN